MRIRRGRLTGEGKRIGIVVSRFNEFITRRLLDSALETLDQAGVPPKNIEVVWVPGALEVPYFCRKLGAAKRFDALIALGCILRGGTYHFECVAREITRGVSQAALEKEIPVATGIITADNLRQAVDRAGLKAGNKGAQAALAALELADLNRQLERIAPSAERRAPENKAPRRRNARRRCSGPWCSSLSYA